MKKRRFLVFLVLALLVISCNNGSPDNLNSDGLPGSDSSITYAVIFHVNGGSGAAPSSQIVNAGSTIPLPTGDGLSRSGYAFGGWNTNASGTEINYPAGASFTVTGNITLYAKWNAVQTITCTVSFSANGGTGTPPNPIIANSGQSITLPGPGNLRRDGYAFGGWNTNAAGTQVNISEGSSYTPIGNVTLYAKWNDDTVPAPTSYTISFSPSPPNPITVEAGKSANLPTPPSRSGYTFKGWSFNANGSGALLSAGGIIPSGSFTLYAVWEEIVIVNRTVTFHANGGSGTPPAAITRPDGESITLPGPGTLTRTGFNFVGWTTQADGNGFLYKAGYSVTPSGNLTMYAYWNDATPTVTSVIVSPTPANTMVQKGKTQLFVATVNGTNNPNQTVTWSIVQTNKHSDTNINVNGLLTVSASESLTSLTVRATSTVDTSKSGTANITVTAYAPIVERVTVSPSVASVAKGGTQEFIAIVNGNPEQQMITWTVTGGGAGTSINSSGVLTVAPNENATSLTVRATSTINTSRSGTAAVTVTAPVTVTGVTVVPTNTSVIKGETKEFSAIVYGTNNPAQTVTWTVTGGGAGTSINSSGVLIVASNESATRLTVRATSTVDTSKSGTAIVELAAASVPLSTPVINSVSLTSPTSNTISWSDVSGAVRYFVFRSSSSSSGFSVIASPYPPVTSYTDTGLSANTTYYYYVSAQNAAGDSSSSQSVPSRVKATFNANGGTGTVPADIHTGYNSYFFMPSGSLSRTNYSFAGWSRNASPTDYFTPIKAQDTVSNMREDTTFYAAWAPGIAPTGLSVTYNGNSVKVSLNKFTGAARYYLFYSSSDFGPYTKLPIEEVGINGGMMYGVPEPGTKFFRVSCATYAGEGPMSTSSVQATPGNF